VHFLSVTRRAPLQGGTVVNHDRQFKADVLIKDGVIVAVGSDVKVGATVIRAIAAAPTAALPSAALPRGRGGWF
jgi:dihydroorotase-like cyclic amidohydrolase